MSFPIPRTIIDELHTLIPDLVIITPEDEDYEESIERWFFLSARRAGAVVYPTNAAQVSTILKFTQKHSIPIAVKGGGHGLRGESSTEGGIVIDISKMKGVKVDGIKIIARGGATWSEVYAEAEKFELAAVGGVCPDVGVGGFVLHGGYGFLTSKHGLGCDNILELEVALADGSIVRASENENQDLFWAMRGAGGCFGIVTEFVLKGHEQKTMIWMGKMMFPKSAMRTVTEMANRILEDEEGTAAMGYFWVSTTEGVLIEAIPFYNGPEEKAREFYAPLLRLDAISNETRMMPFSQSGDTATPAGKWRKLSVPRSMIYPLDFKFLEERMREFEDFLARVPDAKEQSIISIEVFGTRIVLSAGQHDTAFADRGNHVTVRSIPIYSKEENDEVCIEFCLGMDQKFQREFAPRQQDPMLDETTRSSTGVYLNYDGLGLSPKEVFGGNYDRLVELKSRYDPQNVFKNCIDLLQ